MKYKYYITENDAHYRYNNTGDLWWFNRYGKHDNPPSDYPEGWNMCEVKFSEAVNRSNSKFYNEDEFFMEML